MNDIDSWTNWLDRHRPLTITSLLAVCHDPNSDYTPTRVQETASWNFYLTKLMLFLSSLGFENISVALWPPWYISLYSSLNEKPGSAKLSYTALLNLILFNLR